MEIIRNVEINQLHDFRNHPFKVEVNTELCELMKSIEKEGVIVPLLVRTNPYGEGYEVISGHRRKEAAVGDIGSSLIPMIIKVEQKLGVTPDYERNLVLVNAIQTDAKNYGEKQVNRIL